MPVPMGSYQHGPSCFDRIKLGFIMGFIVGLTSGAVLGGFSAFRAGCRGKDFIQSTGKIMLQGGGTFGVFMAVGSGIRC